MAAKADSTHQYHGAIRPDGRLRRARDLTEADITTLKASATDLTTESSGIYTVEANPLALLNSGVDAKGNFNLSGVLFIPPPNTAGTLTAELSLTTSQGNTTQATTFGATADGGRFTFEISAVADAPTLNLATDLSVTGTEDVTGGIDLSGLVSASSTGGDIVGTFLVYLTRPVDDTSASLQAYLAGRGLIDVDASGKVIPRLNLVDGSGDPIGNFIADVGADKFFFAVKTSQTESEAFDANIVFPNNFATNVSGTHDPVMVKVSAVSLGGGGTRAEVAEGDMGTISIEVTSVADGVEFNLLE